VGIDLQSASAHPAAENEERPTLADFHLTND
jgi:hypothetical protein